MKSRGRDLQAPQNSPECGSLGRFCLTVLPPPALIPADPKYHSYILLFRLLLLHLFSTTTITTTTIIHDLSASSFSSS